MQNDSRRLRHGEIAQVRDDAGQPMSLGSEELFEGTSRRSRSAIDASDELEILPGQSLAGQSLSDRAEAELDHADPLAAHEISPKRGIWAIVRI
jgi:hypothetical protein